MASVQGSGGGRPPAGSEDRTLWIILGAAGVLLCLVILIGVFLGPTLLRGLISADYSERSLEENIQVVKANPSGEERGDAIMQIIKLGPQAQAAVPALLEAMRDDRKFTYRVTHQYVVHEKASEALAQIGGPEVVKGLSRLLADKDRKMVFRAASTLQRLESGTDAAVPALLAAWDRVTDPQVEREVSAALVKIGGPRAVQGLGEYLTAGDDTQILRAATMLAQMGPDNAAKAVPALFAILKKRQDEPMHGQILAALNGIGGPEVAQGLKAAAAEAKLPETVKELQKKLSDKQPAVRADAAQRLGALGPTAKKAVPALEKLLGDEDSKVRLEAAWAVWLVGRKAGDTFPILVAGLKDGDADVRADAQKRLDQISPKDLWAMDELVVFLQDKDRTLRLETVRAIGRMGPAISKSKKSFEKLADCMIDPDEEFRKLATTVVKKAE